MHRIGLEEMVEELEHRPWELVLCEMEEISVTMQYCNFRNGFAVHGVLYVWGGKYRDGILISLFLCERNTESFL